MNALLGRELSLAWGKGGGALLALAFYAGIAVLLPLSMGSEGEKLKAVAAGSSWVALALSALLSLERLFERDYEDGGLDLLALGAPPLEAVCFIKCIAQWLATGAPLALAAPLVAIGLGADPSLGWIVLATALAGSLGYAFTGGIGAALSLGSRRGGILIAIIVLPLFTPPVIFGAAAIDAFAAGLPWRGAIAFLAAYSLAAVALGPIAMAAAVRNAIS
jgi:heme exporter protein B